MDNKIKSRRGVYYDLSKSPHKLVYLGKTYIFSSSKKMDMFMKKIETIILDLNRLFGKIYTLTDNKKDYDLTELKDKAAQKCYHNMRYK